MASSKSTIKSVDKTSLYFNKYRYKAVIRVQGADWIRTCKHIDDFVNIVQSRYDEWITNKDRYPNGWYRKPLQVSDYNLDLVEELITLKNKLSKADTRFRHEYTVFSIYTNDDKLIKKLIKDDRWKIEKADVSPVGVKYFKNDPPAKYRAYMSGSKVTPDFCSEMIDYLNRTPDLEPSNALYQWLHRRTAYKYSYVWLYSNHFIDYNDERNLMMMKLMFPEAIGKAYKLEKKP